MSKVIAVVEGLTEQVFVREVLAPWLWDAGGVELVASPAGKPGKKGGNSYGKVRRDVINHLKNRHFCAVTTFFDFYGMTAKWPGRVEAQAAPHARKAEIVQEAIRRDLEAAIDDEEITARLIPYVQMHEYEALLFSDPAALAEVMRNEGAESQLAAIRDGFSSPEAQVGEGLLPAL